MRTPSTLSRRSLLLTWAAAGVVGVAGCGGAEQGATARAATAPDVVPPEGATSTGGSGRESAEGPAATPVHLTIPSLAITTPLVLLGLNDNGTVEVPSAPNRAGWFRLGTVPGRRGSAVILGHVDSSEGPAVFADLSTMRPTDRVQVGLSDDTLVTFEVTAVETYANADFPADRVYAGTTRVAELNLVTCGGTYDADRGGYQSNVVVFTSRTHS